MTTETAIITILAALCAAAIYLLRRDIRRTQARDAVMPGAHIYREGFPCDVISLDDDTSLPAPIDGNAEFFKSLATEPDTTKPAKLKPLPAKRTRKPVAKRAAPKRTTAKLVTKPAAKAAPKKNGPKK